MSDKREKQLHERLSGSARTRPEIRLLILFGSRARGDHLDDSDWDFAVRYEGGSDRVDTGARTAIHSLLERVLEIGTEKIDVIDLDKSWPLLSHHIARDGRLLFERETGAFERFRESALMTPDELRSLYRALRDNLELSLRRRGV